MIVYHGSNRKFNELKIDENLVQSNSSLTNEGCGIYFSTDIEIAKSYGKYIYTININNDAFTDFRELSACIKYVNHIKHYILARTKVDLTRYADLDAITNYAHEAKIAISGIQQEIIMYLENNEKFYNEIPEKKRDKIISLLEPYGQTHLFAYMFPYNIKDVGVIKNLTIAYIIDRTTH